MTRKDFIILAKIFKAVEMDLDEVITNKEDIKDLYLNAIMFFCSGQNALFDEHRFKSAVRD